MLLGTSSVSITSWGAYALIGVFQSPRHEFPPSEVTELFWEHKRAWIPWGGSTWMDGSKETSLSLSDFFLDGVILKKCLSSPWEVER